MMSCFFFCLIEREAYAHDKDGKDDSEWILNRYFIEIYQDHLHPDKCEDKCKSYRKIAETVYHTDECKIQRPHTQYGKYIRRIDDKCILSDGEDGGDAIDSEYEICRLDKKKRHEKWCPVEFRVLSDEEFISVKFFFEWYDFAHPLDHETLVRIYFHFSSIYKFPCCIEEKCPEDIDDPMKILDEWDSRKDKYSTEEYGSEHSPK